jgi:hypothetical protein
MIIAFTPAIVMTAIGFASIEDGAPRYVGWDD